MAQISLALDPDGVIALLTRAFPGSTAESFPRIADLAPGRIHMVAPYRDGLLRPGGVISGAHLMTLADNVAYALVLAHIGDQLMAVTSTLTINFLRGCAPGDVHIEGDLLRLGRRLAVCDIRLWSEAPGRLAAQASVTYAIPS